jgi:hypothetical protein
MPKYSALGDYLKRQHREMVPMTFSEIEKVTGTKLPPSARKHRPWWSNNPRNSVMTQVWLEAGFASEQVDMQSCKLIFRRIHKPKLSEGQETGSEKPFHPLYGHMAGLVRIMPGTDLTQPADPDWADRLNAKYGPEQRKK